MEPATPKLLAELVVPTQHLGAEAVHEQQRAAALIPDLLIGEGQPVDGGGLN
jgi:hypothetical protein